MIKDGMKTAAILALILMGAWGQVQAQGYLNRHPFDLKRFNLGLLMGFNYNSYNLKEQINITENGRTLYDVELISRPGVNIGMITNLNLAKAHSLRLIPTISLEQRDVNFHYGDGSETKKIEASYLNLPLVWQYKTAYYEATRVYTLLGVQWGANLASNEKVLNDPSLLKIRRQDISLVIGFGVNLYGDRLKLSPEIVYKMGLFNIYEPLETDFSSAISSLHSQVLSINVNFE